jgi:signal transduction histidine kinase
MKITTKLILAFFAASILPLSIVGYIGLQGMERASSLALDESVTALKELGEESIHQRALAVALQVGQYLALHPELHTAQTEQLQAEDDLLTVALQQVGETGYTAMYDSDGITHIHPNPAIVGTDLHSLADSLPAFWAIFEASLEGSPASGYYEWQDADGIVRDKYMSCVPVGDTHFRIAATTYIDEFFQPVNETENELARIANETQGYLILAVSAIAVLALGLALASALGISRPVYRLSEAAAALERDAYEPDDLAKVVLRKDDLGKLARVFDRMAKEVQAREENLQRQIRQLRVQIDEAKRVQQVAEVTETEYFRKLQADARELRRAPDSEDKVSEE